jgi:hypothetical protein
VRETLAGATPPACDPDDDTPVADAEPADAIPEPRTSTDDEVVAAEPG